MDSAGTSPWRSLDLADVPAMTTLFEEIEEADRYGWHFGASLLARWLDDPVIDLGRGTRAAFDAGRMIAVGVLAASREADPVHAMRYEGGVHPGYRGRGLGTALLDWAADAAVPLHADRFPEQPLSLQCGFPESDDGAAALFARHGFQPVRYFATMTHDLARGSLPLPRVPDGFQIVPYRPDLDEPMRVAKNEAFRDHWDVAPTPREIWRSRYTGPEFQPDLSPLALDASSGQIAGLIVTHLNAADTAATGRRDAHLQDVATLRPARGRGVATALMATMLRAACARGFDTASLSVDTENPTGALTVYQKSGFTVVDTWVTYRREIPLG